ncbi:hypothetical protein [Pseudomonas sp.]|uniref:hypothetical protein n=1 Tax=Pseudomonas sp. TaxID=306 RepID=UPI003FD8457D
MKTSKPAAIQLAEEAEFQLTIAHEQLQWFGAIARAIARDAENHGGRDIRILSDLAKYLDDTGLAGIETAIDQFKKIAASHSATQNVDNEIVSRTSVEVSQ